MLASSALILVCTVAFFGACGEGSEGPGPSIELHAAESWYREAVGEEDVLTGRLERREPVAGPGSRTELRFTLETRTANLPIYSAGIADRLEKLVGCRVMIRGKVVDLSAEGFGRELWAGSIEKAPSLEP